MKERGEKVQLKRYPDTDASINFAEIRYGID